MRRLSLLLAAPLQVASCFAGRTGSAVALAVAIPVAGALRLRTLHLGSRRWLCRTRSGTAGALLATHTAAATSGAGP